MNKDTALHFFRGSQHQIEEFLGPIPDERMAEQPAGVRNHPAWTMAHLSGGISMALQLLGRDAVTPDAWTDLAGMGTIPTDDRSAYPSKDELLSTYRNAHESLSNAVAETSDETLETVMPIEAYRPFFPTIGHAVSYFLLCHEPTHLGQMQAWRRAAGLAPKD